MSVKVINYTPSRIRTIFCSFVVLTCEARIKRRTLHVPNLISVLRTCEVRSMNQLRSTDFYLGRPCRSFDRACRIERQKIDFDSYVELSHVPNLMHK